MDGTTHLTVENHVTRVVSETAHLDEEQPEALEAIGSQLMKRGHRMRQRRGEPPRRQRGEDDD